MGKARYLTGMHALNRHGIDWHSSALDFSFEYPEEVRKWAGDWGVVRENGREVADPVRAFLDFLFYEIRYRKAVPCDRVEDLGFSPEQEREIAGKVEELLEPVLTEREREILKKWKRYNEGGRYEPARRTLADRKAWKGRFGTNRGDAKSLEERIGEVFGF